MQASHDCVTSTVTLLAFDLRIIQLERRLATKHLHHHRQLALLLVDLLDLTDEAAEGSEVDLYRLTNDIVADGIGGLHLAFLGLTQHRQDLMLGHGLGATLTLAVAHEVHHVSGVLQRSLDLAGELELYKHVTREHDLLLEDLLPGTRRVNLLGRHENLRDVLGKHRIILPVTLDHLLNLHLLARNGAQDVPLMLTLRHSCD